MADRLPQAANSADAGNNGVDSVATATRVSPFYSNMEAAAYLNLSPRTLEKMRVIGGGPAFRKFGRRVLYTLLDLEEWAGRRQCDSTSDPAWKRPPVDR